MNRHQLQAMQRKRLVKNKPAVPVQVERCRYCSETLVRLKTVARCFEVVRLEQDHVVWVDEMGRRRRDGIMTKDHVFPKSKGGTNDPTNVVFSCGPCNVKKADRIGIRMEDGNIFLHPPITT